MKRPILIIVFCACAGLATGCMSVGPDYERQDPPMPARYGSLVEGLTSNKPVDDDLLTSWWTILQDPVLSSLIERAVNRNLELQIAAARVLKARAEATVSSSTLLPEGGPSGSYQRVRRTESGLSAQSNGTGAVLGDREGDLFLAGFDASWEIDIFGGLRREIEAAYADLAASQDALRDTLVTLQGEVGRYYIELRGLQLRLETARNDVDTRRDNLAITQARARAGLVTQLDVARAQGELANAEARIPALEGAISSTIHRLGVLLGLEPTTLGPELYTPHELPQVPENLPAGLPSDLLRRRPDIRRAEREVAAATARIGVSTAELFPRFSLTGSFGYQSDHIDHLPRDASNFWRIGPAVRWPILNFRRILAQIEASKAVRQEAIARYENTVLLSLEEVENALVSLSREQRRTEALRLAVQADDLALQLAMERYRAGTQSYLAVIDAQAALYAAEDQLVQSRKDHALAFVALYKALGGGWLERDLMEGSPPQ